MDTHDDGYRERGREFATRFVAESVESRERDGHWDSALFRLMGDEGFLSACLPVTEGGDGFGAAASVELLRGFGEGAADMGLALAWCMHSFGCLSPLATFGGKLVRQKFVNGLSQGTLVGAWAHEERSECADRLGIRMRAVRSGSRWILEGTKTCVVNGPIADVFVVTAVTDPDRGKDGVSAFVVEKGMRGVLVGPPLDSFGLRTARIAELTLQRCEVSTDHVLGRQGTGLTDIHASILRAERAALPAPWVGAMRRMLDQCISHVRSGHQFGRALSGSQQMRARIADVRIQYELCSRLLERSGWLLEHAESPGAARDLASARLFMTQSMRRMILEARFFFGVSGHSLLDRLSRDMAVFEQMGGGPDRLRPVIAGSLLNLG